MQALEGVLAVEQAAAVDIAQVALVAAGLILLVSFGSVVAAGLPRIVAVSGLTASAMLTGLIIAVIVVAGFLVWGLFKPKNVLDADGIVVGKQSGAMYVFVTNPEKRLIPVTNLASARLILLAQQAAGGGAPTAGTGAAEPKLIDDSALQNISRFPVSGIPGAPQDIPNANELVEPKWSMCDTTRVNEADRDPTETPAITTTVQIGLGLPGRPLTDRQALLLRYDAPDETTYHLVYNGHSHKIDATDDKVQAAFRMPHPETVNSDDRLVSVGLLNAIPPGDELVAPTIPGSGDPSTLPGLGDLNVGDVFRVEVAQQGGTNEYWVILRDGVQKVPRTLADLLLAMRRDRQHIVLVGDGGRPRGVLTLDDVVHAVVGEPARPIVPVTRTVG